MDDTNIVSEALVNGGFFVGRTWLRYLVVCGGAFLLFWVAFAKRLKHRRCQQTIPERRIQWIELKNSLLGVIFFMIPSVLATPLYLSGHIKLILDPSATSPWMIALSFVLFIIGADTWFYWTHRAMHDSRVYRFTHELHHISVQPSPLAGYAFSVFEGFVLGLYLPLVLLFVPINRVMLWVFVFWFSFLEAYVHLGFEILPRWVARNPISKYLGTAVFHDMHHENGAYNFGVYFTWWDRMMGTIHPDYTQRYEQVTEHPLAWRPEPEAEAPAAST
ncbi:sterol desaturase family protein [Enhygromyxa salina]|uniref:Sterol desaturase family protein n=1 Tax=Enhygromyxa salina TaxID=215803 RepID=A0A0C2D0Z5_9BACT|nr:sterol desaturase family protein [Enhygromyxa salina]KIG16901.1 sterol desaturase family protein [Enhygromyxa salina]